MPVRGFLDLVYAMPPWGFLATAGVLSPPLPPLREQPLADPRHLGRGGREVEWVGEKGWVGRRPCCRGGVAERAVTMTTRQFCTPKGRGGAVRPPTGSRGDRKPGLERKKKREGTWWRVGEAVWGEKNEEERCDTHVDIPTVVRTLP